VPCYWFCHVGGVVRVNDHLEQRVWIAWALFGNQFLFLVERLYIELFIRGLVMRYC